MSPVAMLQRTVTAEATAMIGPAELEDIRLDLEAEEQAQKVKDRAAAQDTGDQTAARFPISRDRLKEAEMVIEHTGPGDR